MTLLLLQAAAPVAPAPPIPASSPLPSGALWGLIIPALLFVFTAVSTYLLYRRFEKEESQHH